MSANVSVSATKPPVYSGEQIQKADRRMNIAMAVALIAATGVVVAYSLHQAHVIAMQPADMALTVGIRAIALGATIAHLGTPRGYGFNPVSEEGPEDLKHLPEDERLQKYDKTLRTAKVALLVGTILSVACSFTIGGHTLLGEHLSQEAIAGLNGGAILTFGTGYMIANMLERRVPHTHKTKKEREKEDFSTQLFVSYPDSYYLSKMPKFDL